MKDYKFELKRWPPSDTAPLRGRYLLGFDGDNQPYIIKWEDHKQVNGWVASTLTENRYNESTAVPRHYIHDVGKIIEYYAEAPKIKGAPERTQADEMRVIFRYC